MKTCIYCGRTFSEDVRVCPACGLNLEQAPENIMGPIEIDVEPEPWIPPHQQAQETPPPRQETPPAVQRQAPQPQRAEPEQAAAQTLSPELLRIFRGNQHMYIFRMLLLIVIALCLLLDLLLNFRSPYSRMDMTELIATALPLVAPGLLGGLWGLLRCFTRLKKTPSELAAQISASPHGVYSLFSVHERIILKTPVLGILLGAGAVYTLYMLLPLVPLGEVWHNICQISRIGGQYPWQALEAAENGFGVGSMELFCLVYPLRTIRLLMLGGQIDKTA